MCLSAEWVQDHIEKIIDRRREGTRLRGERRGRKEEKPWSLLKMEFKGNTARRSLLLLPISLLPL